MNKQLLERAAELARRGESFVLAVVVRREPYSSSQQGDSAIITADGSYHGWLGGNCTRPQVLREAAQALVDVQPTNAEAASIHQIQGSPLCSSS